CKCHRQLGRLAEASATARRGLELADAYKDTQNAVALTVELALSQRAAGDDVAARASYEKAIALAESLPQRKDLLADCLCEYGLFHAQRFELREAQSLYERVLTLGPSPTRAAATFGELANVGKALGEYTQALDDLRQTLEIARESKNRVMEAA